MTELKGDLRLLHDDLNSSSIETKKESLKKVIVYMSVGRDVSPIFQDVIKCLEISDIEIKKLVYLYIITYSRARPNDAIMIINQFCRDTKKSSPPLVRALAFRTMGCLRVSELNEYLITPLKEGLQDQNAYVRKNAVMCVPKVYEISPELIIREDIITTLQDILLKDSNFNVVANSIQALHEMGQTANETFLSINSDSLGRILLCLESSFEWGQAYLIDLLSNLKTWSQNEAELIIEKVIPRLAHINLAVVFSSVKCICSLMEYIEVELRLPLLKKLRPALKSLISSNTEIIYAVLKYLQSVVMIYPELIGDEFQAYLCNYNDPLFIKLEKMKLMLSLCSQSNARIMLNEFFEYHKEFNVDFVRMAIQYIYRIALKVKQEAPYALQTYKKILSNQNDSSQIVGDVAEGAAVIMRAYPKVKGGSQIAKELASKNNLLRTQEAKAAFVWMLGQYCETLEGAGPILETYSEQFFSQTSLVQQQVLNAGIKMYLNDIEPIDTVLQTLFQKINSDCNNPDLRDKCYMYWRLLFKTPEESKKVIFAEMPPTKFETEVLGRSKALALMKKGGTVSSHLQKDLDSVFTKKLSVVNRGVVELDTEVILDEDIAPKKSGNNNKSEDNSKNTQDDEGFGEIDLLGNDDLLGVNSSPQTGLTGQDTTQDLMGGDLDILGADSKPQALAEDEEDLFGDASGLNPEDASFIQPDYISSVKKDTKGRQGKSLLSIKSRFFRKSALEDSFYAELLIKNKSDDQVTTSTIQLGPNFAGFKTSKINPVTIENNGGQTTIEIPITFGGKKKAPSQSLSHPIMIDMAFKCSRDTYFFKIPFYFHFHLISRGRLGFNDFEDQWMNLSNVSTLFEEVIDMVPASCKNLNYLENLLQSNNIFVVNNEEANNGTSLFISMKTLTQQFILAKIGIDNTIGQVSIEVRTNENYLLGLVYEALSYIIQQQSE